MDETIIALVSQFRSRPRKIFKDRILELMRQDDGLDNHLGLEAHLLDLVAMVALAEQSLEELREQVSALTAPPGICGILTGFSRNGEIRAVVSAGGNQRIETAIMPDVDPSTLSIGDIVVLNHDSTCVLGCRGQYQAGEIAEFDHRLPNGKLILKDVGGIQLCVEPSATLADVDIKSGTKLRFSRDAAIAYEVIEEAEQNGFLNHMEDVSFSDVGGLSHQIEIIKERLFWPLRYPEHYRRYSIRPPRGILLTGAPGTGKTLLARAAIREALHMFTGNNGNANHRQNFLYVKGPEFLSMWVGETERAIRNTFRRAKDISIATSLPVILFWDEIESLIPTRGSRVSSSIESSIVPTFLSELDGLTTEGQVVLIAASNRPDVIDPAMLRPGRIDFILDIPRPDRAAACEVFNIHLPKDIPYGRGNTQREIIDAAVSYIFREDDESTLATIMYRDGTRQSIRAHHLLSGAMVRNVCEKACMCALRRELITGQLPEDGSEMSQKALFRDPHHGITTEDLFAAIDEECEAVMGVITPSSVGDHITLPHDVDVVAVEPVLRRASHPFLAYQSEL